MIPCNLQRGNTFCKHLNKGERRGRVRSASVSWRYWGPGTHPESCLQSPRCRGQSTRPKSPGSTRSQWSCRTEVREEWWTAAATVVKLGHPGAAAHCWHCPECPCFCHLKILVHHINQRGYLTTKVNYLLWTFKGFLKWGGVISLVTCWRECRISAGIESVMVKECILSAHVYTWTSLSCA